MTHPYPHCWRCKQPIIFRATEQWFISMEKNGLRQKALTAIGQVTWIPRWGRERIYQMVERRPDLVHLPAAVLGDLPSYRLSLPAVRPAAAHPRAPPGPHWPGAG